MQFSESCDDELKLGLKMKKLAVTLLVILILVVVFAGRIILNPARRTTDTIRIDLLERTPVGTSAEEVLRFVREDLRDNRSYHERTPTIDYDHQHNRIVGESKITAVIGSYWPFVPGGFVVTTTYAFWVFDKNDKLIEIIVYKENDGF